MESAQQPEHLAWHETLEIHELVAFQSIGLLKLKDSYADITDPALKNLYKQAINGLSTNVEELLAFFPKAPYHRNDTTDEIDRNAKHSIYVGDLLALFKSGIKNYAIALSETATPSLREVLKKQFSSTVDMHAKIFTYMKKEDLYPAYDLEKLLTNDTQLAKKALSKTF